MDDATQAADDTQAEPRRGEAPLLVRGQTVGRYVVLEQAGSGAMGIVYAAYDPELDRKVALKLLHERGSDHGSGHRRLLREAQAMARLSHPNVVGIHDVGEHDGRIFLALELVEGESLRAWLRARQRPWRDVVGVLMLAGRGLAAAHDSGIIHRDFKPDNVLVGADGSVRVTDFGLALSASDSPSLTLDPSPSMLAGEIGSGMTSSRRWAGTPAYMAPEQHAEKVFDARADQFAFCVTLYEGVYRTRPFEGNSPHEVAAAIAQARLIIPVSGHVPARVRRAILRGLAHDPDARWPTMGALLHELERDPTARTRMLVGVGVAGLAVAGAFGWMRIDAAARVAACANEGASLDATWNAEARGRVEQALHGVPLPDTDAIVQRVLPRIDSYAATWSETREQVCLAATVEQTQTTRWQSLANACLDERRAALGVLVDVLGEADTASALRAVTATMELPLLAPCTDVTALARRDVSDLDERTTARVAAIRLEHIVIRELHAAARFDDAAKRATAALAEAETLGFVPLIAEARYVLAFTDQRLGRDAEARAGLELAHYDALGAAADEVALDAAIQLVHLVGHIMNEPGPALAWARTAQALLDRLREGEDARVALLLNNMGSLHRAAGRFDEAIDHHQRALAIRERLFGEDHGDVAQSLNNLANAEHAKGDHAAALAHHERALEMRERLFGTDHPLVAESLENKANVESFMEDHDEAIASFERALAIRERVFGPDHTAVANTLSNLGVTIYARGEHDRALHYALRALAIREKSGKDNAEIGDSHSNIGVIRQALGDLPAARGEYRQALAIHEKTLGPDHPDVAGTLSNLAHIELLTGDVEAATAAYARALAIRERVFDADHHDVAASLVNVAIVERISGKLDAALAHAERAHGILSRDPDAPTHLRGEAAVALGRVLEARGDLDRAIVLLESGVALRREVPGQPAKLGEAAYGLARALERRGSASDRASALTSAVEARDGYARAGKAAEAQFLEAEAWIAARR